MKKNKIAVVGASGLVGQTFLHIIQDDIDFFDLKLYASSNSAGKRIKIKNKYYVIHPLSQESFDDVDYACFFTSPSISKNYIPIALSKKVKVIDNSSFFRMNKNVPLVINGVNNDIIEGEDNLIANPNCCIIQSLMIISLLKKHNIKRVIYNTYQSVSGSGKQGIDDLLRCRKGLMPLFYETDISFTCIPKIGEYNENGFLNDLGNEEIQIIADFMKVEWLNRCIMTWENVKPLYVERDFSQGNLIDKLRQLLEFEKKKAQEAESIYYRSRNGKPFNFGKLASNPKDAR